MTDLTLEKLEIVSRLTALEVKVDNTSKLVQEVHDSLIGSNDSPGLKIEVDRLKQIEKKRELHGTVAITTAIGLVLKTVWDVFTRR